MGYTKSSHIYSITIFVQQKSSTVFKQSITIMEICTLNKIILKITHNQVVQKGACYTTTNKNLTIDICYWQTKAILKIKKTLYTYSHIHLASYAGFSEWWKDTYSGTPPNGHPWVTDTRCIADTYLFSRLNHVKNVIHLSFIERCPLS